MPLDLDGFNELNHVDTDPDETIIERLRFDDAMDIPWQLTDVDLWSNYCDDDLYFLDKKVREFLKSTRWTRETKGRQKTAVPLIFAWIFGRKPSSKDSQVCVTLHALLKYYCSKYTGTTQIKGQRFTRVYYFNKYAARHKRPYSLRLRLEEKNDEASFRPYGTHQDKRAYSRFRDSGDGKHDDGGSGSSK